MSHKFASGKYALGLCDRCGFRYKLNSLRVLIINDHPSGTLVCGECWEGDHPQLKLGKYPISDPQGLRNPRPDPALAQSRALFNTLQVDENPLLVDGSFLVFS